MDGEMDAHWSTMVPSRTEVIVLLKSETPLSQVIGGIL
jgi:hypothetical protein